MIFFGYPNRQVGNEFSLVISSLQSQVQDFSFLFFSLTLRDKGLLWSSGWSQFHGLPPKPPLMTRDKWKMKMDGHVSQQTESQNARDSPEKLNFRFSRWQAALTTSKSLMDLSAPAQHASPELHVKIPNLTSPPPDFLTMDRWLSPSVLAIYLSTWYKPEFWEGNSQLRKRLYPISLEASP